MEPISALALACNILDLIDRAFKYAAIIKQIRDSETGLREKHEKLMSDTEGLSAIADELRHVQHEVSQAPVDARMREVAMQCNSICAAIQTIVEKCRRKRERSLLSAAGASIRIMLHKSDIEELQAQLESGQKMLMSLVSIKTLADMSKAKKELANVGRQIFEQTRQSKHYSSLVLEKLGTLDDYFRDISESMVTLQQLKDLLNAATEASDAIKIAQLLGSLYFPTMNERFRAVNDSAPCTFGWIFEEPQSLIKHQPGLQISFTDWLESGSGIFHIEGKPGSGKSTLMKYLCEHDMTLELLRTWAEGRTLIFSQFFFWRLGTPEERSLGGLIRGLLSGVILQYPPFAKLLFPKHWSKAGTPGLARARVIDLPDKEVVAAFDLLVGSPEIFEKVCLCFFIDGLDEFDENNGHTAYRLTEMLRQWASGSRQNVKLCVSSRQLPVFVSAFSPTQRLTLQIFTQDDIAELVSQRLEKNAHFQAWRETRKEECNEIVEHILQHAEGVFLWVTVLLNQLEDGLVSGDSIEMLEAIVRSAPIELDDFICHILDSIPPRYRRHAFTFLTLAMRLKGTLLSGQKIDLHYEMHSNFPNGPAWELSLFSCSCLLEGLDRGTLAQAVKEVPTGFPTDLETFWHRIERARTRITAQCRGLIEAQDGVIKFTHRSIPEILQRFLVGRFPLHELNDNLVTTALAWMTLVDISYKKGAEPERKCKSEADSDISLIASNVKSVTGELWTDAELAVGEATGRLRDLVFCARQSCLDNHESTFRIFQLIEQMMLSRSFKVMKLVDLPPEEHSYGFLLNRGAVSIITLSAVYEPHGFFLWDYHNTSFSLTNGVEWFRANILRSLIATMPAILSTYGLYDKFFSFRVPIVKCLLGSGLNLDMKFDLRLGRLTRTLLESSGVNQDFVMSYASSLDSEDHTIHENYQSHEHQGARKYDRSDIRSVKSSLSLETERLNLWTYFIASFLAMHSDLPFGKLWLDARPSALWNELEIWLRHGVNCDITLAYWYCPWIDDDTDSTTSFSSDFRSDTDRNKNGPGNSLWIVARDHNGIDFLELLGLESNFPSRLRSFMDLFESSGGTLTLADFLKFNKPPNLETLLMLIESKNKALGNTASTDHPQATTDDLDTIGGLQGNAAKEDENENVAPVLVETLPTIYGKPQSISIPWMAFTVVLALALSYFCTKLVKHL
ncbi:hypothetical protein S40293_07367 [Stachybotrys chartarum IBT 40293]|nr:hypothetical protein S40293_07367 [Stachybotrys chartarum IBT 40293]